VYLKRLELTGFKSFATKTVFDFGQGMTAIVGPNGSGKSNIADALRWVLGETSNRLIRAKKLEDVIYAGSAKRAKADKVEVSMVLDNSARWLPLDEEEVTITRRGSRNGDSDYFVNRHRTKLRDIQTILATASVSQNSYAIIGQGLVESVLSLRPDERREMIEEAADIQRYRYKIEEAQNRLKQTAENVERVKLLVKEIAPRMGALERQAKKAGEYSRLSSQLHQALRTFYEQRWDHAQEALTVARAGHDQAQAEFLQAKVSLESVQRELDEITTQLDQNRKAFAGVLEEREALDQIVRESDQRIAVARERRSILQVRQAELAEELTAVEAEKTDAAAVLASGDSDRRRLEEAVAAARQAMIDRQGELAALEAELRAAHVHAADADAKAKRLEATAADMRVRSKNLRDSSARLSVDVSRLETRRRSIINQMAEHVRILKGLRGQDAQFLTDASRGGARRESLDAEIAHLRESLALVEENQAARRAKLEGLDARLQVLQEATRTADVGEAANLDGAVSALYEILRVPRGLEVAIASVLGEQLDSFVFNHQSDAVAAIYALVRGDGPRAAAIPMDSMKQVYPLNVAKEKGVLGVASSLVKYPPRFEKLINSLLGRVVVVDDVDTAIRLLKRRVGTIVTTDGIVFDQTGFIWGGRPGDAKSFVLAYERDLESIPGEMDRIQRAMDVTEREAELIRDRLGAAETALSELTRGGDDVLGRRLQLQDQIVLRQQKLAQLRGELRGAMGQIENLRQQQKSLEQQAAALDTERDGLLEEAAEAAETAKHLGKADTLFEERHKLMQEALDAATDALGRVDAELRSFIVQKETAAATLARIDAQANAKAVQLRGIEMEVSTLESTITQEEQRSSAAREQLERLIATLPDGEGTRHLEARQADLHRQVVSGQTRTFEAERRSLETEAEVRRWDTEIENLHMRMTEDGLIMKDDGTVIAEKGSLLDIEAPAWLIAEEDGPGGLRPMRGGAIVDGDALGKEIEQLRAQLRQIGPVNVEAQVDYESLRERHDFLSGQLGDLENAERALHRAIGELTQLMRKKFELTFEQVAKNFEANFDTFFGGGRARLKLTDPRETETSGVEVEARPPGKRTNSLAQLSGGEKSLTSVALLFALLQVNPAPFCVLDEVDAMLDEANVGRFAGSIKEQSRRTQFIVITHNRRTIEQADSIYGISMAPDAASRVLSMRLADVTAATGLN
jgi:chromosome segregation protein